ncbi:hypothetical protein [Kitasatospora phosalacinea]|uniref:Uncharacterized protein n=1 Tax=Kitasatospora phosalacinea TaxID=2065 RepID=A0ABW6GRQ6_9ACTN
MQQSTHPTTSSNSEPLPRRDPGATFRKPPATVGKPGPKAA